MHSDANDEQQVDATDNDRNDVNHLHENVDINVDDKSANEDEFHMLVYLEKNKLKLKL